VNLKGGEIGGDEEKGDEEGQEEEVGPRPA
jgi:hypothetical protein